MPALPLRADTNGIHHALCTDKQKKESIRKDDVSMSEGIPSSPMRSLVTLLEFKRLE